jgi:hypothetical protein
MDYSGATLQDFCDVYLSVWLKNRKIYPIMTILSLFHGIVLYRKEFIDKKQVLLYKFIIVLTYSISLFILEELRCIKVV